MRKAMARLKFFELCWLQFIFVMKLGLPQSDSLIVDYDRYLEPNSPKNSKSKAKK